MRKVKTMFAGRVALRAITLAALAVAAVVGTLSVRDAVAPAEARSRIAEQVSSADTARGARVRIEALGTQRNGITGRPRSVQIDALAVDDVSVRFLRAGSDADPSVCQGKFSPDPTAGDVLLWKFETKVVRADGAGSTLQVHWIRWRAGNPVAQRDETRTVTLGPGDTHVLDFVENQADPSAACASLMVRIAADPILPEASQPLTVDLWTVDESAAAGARSVHVSVQGRGGVPIKYELPPLDIVPAGASTTSREAVKMNVVGTVQATLAPDGDVVVTLATVRKTVSGKAAIQGEGRVEYRTKVGETAAVLLPEPTGRLPLPGGEGSLDIGRLFAGHRLSLYVKVEPTR